MGGMKEIDTLIDYYMGNAALLRQTMLDMGLKVHGGTDAPYVFVDLEGQSSWDMFSKILEESQIVTIPGAGFGPGGEGFLRLSAFASARCARRRASVSRSQASQRRPSPRKAPSIGHLQGGKCGKHTSDSLAECTSSLKIIF